MTQIPRSTLRSRVVGVAEEPFFFPGTVRENMNPWSVDEASPTPTTVSETSQGGSVSDARLIAALEEVELWRGEGRLEDRGGLDAALDPDALSTGQRQLFNIARAVVRGGSVVVMDEVTSRYVC